MGAASSQQTVEDAGPPLAADSSSLGARLFKYDAASVKWSVHRALVEVSFTDTSEEAEQEDAEPSWFLIVADVTAEVSDLARIVSEAAQLRVSFVAEGVWALRFLSKQVCRNASALPPDAASAQQLTFLGLRRATTPSRRAGRTACSRTRRGVPGACSRLPPRSRARSSAWRPPRRT
jgi:hypothetical protein